jgi:hypothetical protein
VLARSLVVFFVMSGFRKDQSFWLFAVVWGEVSSKNPMMVSPVIPWSFF